VLTIGNSTVPSASTVPVFTVPPGFCNIVFWTISTPTVFIGTSPSVSGTAATTTAITCHSVPTSFESYLTSKGVTFYGANTANTGASVQFVLSSDQ
jgi:hypothetical protein